VTSYVRYNNADDTLDKWTYMYCNCGLIVPVTHWNHDRYTVHTLLTAVTH